MREHRWETSCPLSFSDILRVATRLHQLGLTSIHLDKEMIGYIEEWEVTDIEQIRQLDPWATEDITLLHLFDRWKGDFFLLAGRYHELFQQHQSVNTYCSLAHPWRISKPMATLLPEGWLWVGFRHTHGFIRTRVQTASIIAPGETVESPQEIFWLRDRKDAFQSAIDVLGIPLNVEISNGRVTLHCQRTDTPLFCSWPDAFGPCQFEYNSSDSFEFLVPASQLAATHHTLPAHIRIYLTGFSPEALRQFTNLGTPKGLMYRCSIHCTLSDMETLLYLLQPKGRLYGSLAEFQTAMLLPEAKDAAIIIGLAGKNGSFRLEIRLNRHPLGPQDTQPWLESVVGHPLSYSPLPPFP